MAATPMAATLFTIPTISLSRKTTSLRYSLFLAKSTHSAAAPLDLNILKSAIRSEPDPDRLADLFQSSSSSPYLYSDRSLYNFTVQKLTESNRLDLISKILEHQLSDPLFPKSDGFIIRIMTLYSDAGMVDRAVETFNRYPEFGLKPSQRSFCALLTVFFRNKQIDRLRQSFDKVSLELSINPGLVAYTILLRGIVSEGDMTAARLLLDEMLAKGMEPDIDFYNTLLSGYSKEDDEARFEEILKVIESKGFEPNVATYNHMIRRLCEAGRSVEGEEVMNKMSSKGFRPNRVICNTLIYGFCNEGNLSSAMRIYEKLKSVKNPDGSRFPLRFSTYVNLLKGLVEKREFGLALDVFEACVTKKFVMPFESVKGLVRGLMESSRVDDAKDVVAKMRNMLKGDALDTWETVEGEFSL